MTTEKTYEALRATSLFAGFTEEQLEMVPKVGRTRSFPAGECVVRVGDEQNPGLWLVLDGTARVEVEGRVLRLIEAGNHFGEMALLTGEPRSADVFAHTDLTAMEFTDRHLHGLIANEPDVGIAMLAELARRLRTITEDYAELVRKGTPDESLGESIGDDPVLGPIEYALKADADG